ncbi:MAG: type I DNA topoisomerase [Candidatus Spechtbacterales bacterium]|nr:type I DNA topoisomerase [Candidatus Spechtbacterales bacterium]
MSKLVIVESPTKAKTISKFLGDKYIVTSSYGHLRDLPKGELGVDTEKNFEPRYVIPTKSRKKLTALKKKLKDADEVILATDGDREGEAIAWHLLYALGILTDNKKKKPVDLPVERIEFHEITKSAIENALQNPREINKDLVNAQQARRILDRLVGYKLSPFLWKKVMRGLSAGRVQSVAVRLIVEKERERQKFKPKEYWTIEADLKASGKDKKFIAALHSKNGESLDKFAVENKKAADEIVKKLEEGEWKVENVEQKDRKRNPFAPFTTSTLQQAAGHKFGYPAKRTMMLAQNLYERGLITYHRTDSLNLAPGAVSAGRRYIEKEFGKKYLPNKPRFFKTKSKGAQEAHEAIRPTDPTKNPDRLKLQPAQKKLYKLIWQRFLASQMTPAIFAATTIDINTNTEYGFRATGQVMRFPGFLKVYPVKFKEAELPEISKGDALELKKLNPEQHFTKPPARYSEATLIKALEKHGIGRPSTYAPVISTIQSRNYVKKDEQKRLEPTEIGFIVTDLLTEHFPKIVDIDFTAEMEDDLDKIAHGKNDWRKVLDEFYTPFEKKLEKKYDEVKKKDMTEETDKTCPECGKKMLKRMGRYGWFYACSGFPECKHTENIKREGEHHELKDVHCPKCVEGKVVQRKTRKGKTFWGCSRYPDCDFGLWYHPHIEQIEGTTKHRVAKCPKCNKALVIKGKNKKVACSNKECDYKK